MNLNVIRGPGKSFLIPNDRRNLHRRNGFYVEIDRLGLTLTQCKRKNGMTMQYITRRAVAADHQQSFYSSYRLNPGCKNLPGQEEQNQFPVTTPFQSLYY